MNRSLILENSCGKFDTNKFYLAVNENLTIKINKLLNPQFLYRVIAVKGEKKQTIIIKYPTIEFAYEWLKNSGELYLTVEECSKDGVDVYSRWVCEPLIIEECPNNSLEIKGLIDKQFADVLAEIKILKARVRKLEENSEILENKGDRKDEEID